MHLEAMQKEVAMVLDFNKFRQKRLDRAAYRQQLVAKILEYYANEELKTQYSFYLEHIQTEFPVHILENILERLDHGGIAAV